MGRAGQRHRGERGYVRLAGCMAPAAAVEELLTDSRWGCSPIRARLLEDDDNGGPREDRWQRQARDAHSCLPGSVSTG
ncbi:unnamed protein product [Arctogadus glacialis]